MSERNCPILEQTGDGICCGRCWYHLADGKICPRHGDVTWEVLHFAHTGKCTLENSMLKRRGLPLLGADRGR